MPQHTWEVHAARAIEPAVTLPSSAAQCSRRNAPAGCECRDSTGESPTPLFFQLCSSLVPYSWSAGECRWVCWGSVARAAPSPAAELSPWVHPPHLLGLGVLRSSAGGHARARSFQRSGQVVWILLKLLSLREEKMCTNKSSKPLSVFSPAPAFKSLLLSHPSQTPLSSGSSLCLQLFQLISELFNVSSYYDASIYYSNMGKKPHAWEKEKNEDYKYIFLAFCT